MSNCSEGEGYDPAREAQNIARKSAWNAARCPQRHQSVLGVRAGAEWKSAFSKINRGLYQGSLFVLTGPRGTGKTQLAVESIGEIIERSIHQEGAPKCPARYCEIRDFFLDIKETHRKTSKRSEREVLREYAAPQLLVLDEITIRGETDWEDAAFFAIVNRRYAAMRDTILIGNFASTSELLSNIGASIASRLQETGGVVECNWQSFRALPAPALSMIDPAPVLPGLSGSANPVR